MGEFTGHALKRCVERGIERAALAGMIGKLSKIAQGHFMTHVAGNQVDPEFLASVALEAGASSELADRIRRGAPSDQDRGIAHDAPPAARR